MNTGSNPKLLNYYVCTVIAFTYKKYQFTREHVNHFACDRHQMYVF